MPLTDYTLSVQFGLSSWATGGSPQPLDYYKIIDGTATLTAGGVGDKLSLTIEKDARQAAPIPAFSRVKLYYLTNLVWQGISLGTSWSAGIGSTLGHRITVECVGPSYFLSAVPFTQVWQLQSDPENPDAGTTYNQDVNAAIVGASIGNLPANIQLAIEQAAAAGMPVANIPTNIPDFTPASEQLTDVSCLEVIERMQSWMPGVQCRWDHTGSSIHATLEWHSILRPDNLLEQPASDLDVREVVLADLTSWSGSQRFDLLVSEYTITYLRKKLVINDEGVAFLVIEPYVDTATADNGSLVKKASTIPLNGVSWNGILFTEGEPFPALGQAALLLAPFVDINYDLNFACEIDWTYQPLQLLNVTDAATGFEEAWSTVRSVSHSLRNDKTTVQAGSPTGINTSRSITRPARTRKGNENANSAHYGFDPGNNPDAGSTDIDVPPEGLSVRIGQDGTASWHSIVDEGTVVFGAVDGVPTNIETTDECP